MKSVASFTIIAIAIAMAAAADTLTLRPGGSVRLPDDPEGFVPMLKMDGTSLTAIGREAATDKGVRYDFVRRGEVWAHGSAKLRKTAEGARAEWEFKFLRDAATLEYGTTVALNVGRFPEGTFDVSAKGVVRIRDLTAHYPEGFSARVSDGRWWWPWNSVYSVIVTAPRQKDVKAGTSFPLTLDFRSTKPLGVAAVGLCVAKDGDGWVRMDHRKEIIPGSALDFSGLGFLDAPAGKHGWLVTRNGEPRFGLRPDGPAPRFCGVNFCGTANYPETPEDAERYAGRVAALGYNALRLHHHDNLFARYRDGRLEIDSANADRLDRLVAACIRRGIYLTTDLYVSRSVAWRDIGEDRPGKVPVKTWQMVTERGWRDWCDYARLFMWHRNPYTGRTYAEEPAMPLVCIQNETAFESFRVFPEQAVLWREFLLSVREKTPGAFPGYSPDALPPDGLWWNAGAETAVKSAYWAFVQRRFVGRARRFLREELGVKSLLTGDNYGPTPAFVQEMRSDTYDYIDTHLYATGWWEWLGKGGGYVMPMKLKNLNPLQNRSTEPEGYAFSRIWGKPFCVTEWDFVGPDPHRSMGGLLFGTVAAVQGWTGIWRFAYEHGRTCFADNVGQPELYNLARDPLKLASDRVTVMLYLRGDLREAKKSISIDFGEKALDPTLPHTFPSAPGWLRSGVSFAYRVGDSVRGQSVPRGALTLDAVGAVGLKEPPFKVHKPAGLVIDRIRGTFAVDTPRTQGVYTPGADSFDLGKTRIRTDGAATVFVTSLDGCAIPSSSRILVAHLTDALGKEATYMDDAGHVLLSHGVEEKDASGRIIQPVLLKEGTGEVSLPLLGGAAAYAAYALESDGRRAASVPLRRKGGRTVLPLSVRQPFGGCLQYEIVRKRRER